MVTPIPAQRLEVSIVRRLALFITICLLLMGVSLWSSGMGSKSVQAHIPEDAPRQALNNDEVMKFFFDPYYIDLKNALKEKPVGKKGWRAAYVSSFRLAEAHNLLFCREGEDYMGTPRWNVLSVVGRNAATAVGEAVKELDYEKAKVEYLALIESCNICHQRFELEEPTEVLPWL